MLARQIPVLDYDSATRNKILEVATISFSHKGFAAVSMRDIANAAGVNIASIYYHYESKEALLDDVFSFFTRGYKHYFEWLSEMNSKAESLEDVMDNMFNSEFIEMQDPIGCMGMSLAMKEQHRHESARKCVFNLFYKQSIDSMKADFDRLIDKGIIPPADTKTIAMLFMFCVIVSNDIRLHEYMGTQPPLACSEIYNGLKCQIASALTMGNI